MNPVPEPGILLESGAGSGDPWLAVRGRAVPSQMVTWHPLWETAFLNHSTQFEGLAENAGLRSAKAHASCPVIADRWVRQSFGLHLCRTSAAGLPWPRRESDEGARLRIAHRTRAGRRRFLRGDDPAEPRRTHCHVLGRTFRRPQQRWRAVRAGPDYRDPDRLA